MALIKHANLRDLARDAVVLDLGDLHRQGEAILAQARERAAQIVANAQAERQRLLSGAVAIGRAEGVAQGLEEGRAAGRIEGRDAALAENKDLLAKLAEAWTDSLGLFIDHRQSLLADARRDVIRLAGVIAEKVVKRRVALEPSIVESQMAGVLAMVLKPSRLSVSINPADRPLLQAALPEMLKKFEAVAHVELVDDPALARGSCAARVSDPADAASAPGGQIDASIRTQLDRIVEVLLPGAHASTEPAASAEPAPAPAGSTLDAAPVSPPPPPPAPSPSSSPGAEA